ncbi:MAG: heparinase II/III family protein [Planctomycetes bacterium]|nr:heparinase II/III family protein [Planctomycetota bacterium]
MRRQILTAAAMAFAAMIILFQSASVASGQFSASAPAGGAKGAARHPRLFFTAEELPALRQKARAYPSFAQLTSFVDSQRFFERPTPDSRGWESNAIMLAEAFVALITQDPKYIEKAKKQLFQIAGMDMTVWRGTISPPCRVAGLGLGHFSQAVGIGYDWLYPFMTEDERKTIRDALVKKAFAIYKEGVDLNTRSEYWLHITNNWCPVIHGGEGIAALAVRGEIPEADWVLEQTRKRIRNFLDPLPKDGGCVEGTMYGIYGAVNAALFAEALKHVVGTDDGIMDHPGMKKFSSFMICFTGADGGRINFSDCNVLNDISGELYSLVGRYNDKALDSYLQQYIPSFRKGTSAAWEIIFRPPAIAAGAAPPLDDFVVFPDTHWAAMRSDKMQLFFKSGNIGNGHKHADLNTFVMLLNGERLVPTAPYEDKDTNYHSTILVNGKGQPLSATGAIIQSGKAKGVMFATADASKAYGGELTCFLRTAFFAPDRFVAIGDVLAGQAGNKYEWKLQTSETPVISSDKKSARINGKKASLQVQVVLPDNATLSAGRSFGPCLSADVTAAGPSASYFVILAPADLAVSAKATGNSVQVTAGGASYTFSLTGRGWVAAGSDVKETTVVSTPATNPSGTSAVVVTEEKPKIQEKPKPVATSEKLATMDDWVAKLKYRLGLYLKSGQMPKFQCQALDARVNVEAMDGSGQLTLVDRGGKKTVVQWEKLTIDDYVGLAQDMAGMADTALDHALLAYFCHAAKKTDKAQEHLKKAGSYEKAVRDATGM